MKLRLYSYWRSSSSWRVRIGLGLKRLQHEIVPVDLLAGEQFSEAHRARSPLGMIPVLAVEEGGRVVHLVQSMAILEWLEEVFPEPRLLPADALGRAQVRALAEHVNSSIQPFQNPSTLERVKAIAPGRAREWAAQLIATGLDGLERAVQGQAGPFCHGHSPGLADCYLVPQLFGARRFGVDLAPYPTLRRIEGACTALGAFQSAHPDRQPDAPPPERRTP
jgi:maleylpyruvate isomerase